MLVKNVSLRLLRSFKVHSIHYLTSIVYSINMAHKRTREAAYEFAVDIVLERFQESRDAIRETQSAKIVTIDGTLLYCRVRVRRNGSTEKQEPGRPSAFSPPVERGH